MTLIKLYAQDLTEITTLFSEVIIKMQEDGIDQWNDQYPDNQSIKNNIEAGTLFGIRQKKTLAAIVTLDTNYSIEYDELSWSLPSEAYLIVHRLAVRPDFQNQGIARFIMLYAEEYAIKQGLKGIRLDTYSKNPKNLYFYKKLNYTEIGHVYFRDLTDPFVCFEKVLT